MEYSSTFWYIWMIKYSIDFLINDLFMNLVQEYPSRVYQILNE